MKQSKLYIPTLKQTPSDAEAISHQLMLRAGYIRQVSAGVYAYLPLAWSVIQKIEGLIRKQMKDIDAAEMRMPAILPADLWRKVVVTQLMATIFSNSKTVTIVISFLDLHTKKLSQVSSKKV